MARADVDQVTIYSRIPTRTSCLFFGNTHTVYPYPSPYGLFLAVKGITIYIFSLILVITSLFLGIIDNRFCPWSLLIDDRQL